MNRVPSRYQPVAVAAVAIVVLLVVAGGVLLAGGLAPSPSPSASSSSSTTPSASAGASTPEGATRTFFDALIAARRTDDPAAIEPFVTSTDSSAYRTVEAFLAGQRETGKASVTTQLDLEDIQVADAGERATLRATLLEAGYDIDLDSGEPLESPVTLDPRALIVELQRVDGVWKVDSFETREAGAS